MSDALRASSTRSTCPTGWATADVTWTAERGVRGRPPRRRARSTGAARRRRSPCDLLAVDEAYPAPVADDDVRTRAHQAWRHGQVLLVEHDGRLTLAVPGTAFTADRVLDALGRLAKAVGASPEPLRGAAADRRRVAPAPAEAGASLRRARPSARSPC